MNEENKNERDHLAQGTTVNQPFHHDPSPFPPVPKPKPASLWHVAFVD